MKNSSKILGFIATMLLVLTVSCKQSAEDKTQSAERPGYENNQQDSLNETMLDTITVDTNMQGQSDTHGRDTDTGDDGTTKN